MREALWDFCAEMELSGRRPWPSFSALAQHADEPLTDCDNESCQRYAWAFFDWCRERAS